MNLRTFHSFLLGALLLAGWSAAGQAAIVTVPDLTTAVVQAAIDIAADGDTLVLPAGSATWSTRVLIDNKSITLRGAGIGLSTITHNMATNTSCLNVRNTGSKFVRITGFTFIGSPNTTYGIISVGTSTSGTPCAKWRIDHCDFPSTPWKRCILVMGRNEGGVIDHCTFTKRTEDSSQGIGIWGDAQYVLPAMPNGTSWKRGHSIGTADAVFIEDCTFDFSHPNDGAIDAYYGARYVFRHNTVINTNGGGGHGLDSGVSSTSAVEVYENTYISTHFPTGSPPSGFNVRLFQLRGGTGVCFNNKYIVPWLNGPHGGSCAGFALSLDSYRATGKSIFQSVNGGVITGSNAYDGNDAEHLAASGMVSGWPAQQQVGTAGVVTFLSDRSTSALEPFYEWNNTFGVDAQSQTRRTTPSVGPPMTTRASGTNLVIDGSDNTKVTSATRNFDATDVDSWLNITAGSGFTPGWYKIVSASSNAATLARSPGAAGSAGGTWTETWVAIFPSDIIKQNRDYYVNTEKPGYTPYIYPHPLVKPSSPRHLRVTDVR